MDAIVLGGGAGTRFSRGPSGTELPKQFQLLEGIPVFLHAVRSLLEMDCFRQIVITAPRALQEIAQEQMAHFITPQTRTLLRVVAGGDRRQDSSRIALEALDDLAPPCERVLIHDGCRPFLAPAFCDRIKACLLDRAYAAWIPVIPVVETLKRVENAQVVETVDRSVVHRVQTPQIFEYPVIRSLAEKTKESPELTFTDDASLCEYFGIPVGVFEGDVRNIKLTYEFELRTLESVLQARGGEKACASESGTTFTV